MAPKHKALPPRQITRWNYARVDTIHELIYNKTYPTLPVLMETVKASRSAVLRDLRYIECHKQLPLSYSRKPDCSGYFYDGPVPRRIGHTFTEQELFQYFLADKAISGLPVKHKQKRLGLGLDHLGDMLDDRTRAVLDELDGTMIFRPFAPEQIDIETFFTLCEAVRQRRVLQFQYTKHMAVQAELKTVAGYCFTCAANSWYLIGRDVRINEMRTYMLSRLSSPVITEETFRKPKNFSLDDHLDGAFIVMGGNESHDVLIEFDAWAAPYIRNRTFTKDQDVQELPNGGLRIGFHVKCLEEVEAWVSYWRQHALVLSPEPLRERLFAYGQYLVKSYGPK